jgi:hypothetical protein
MSRNDNEHVVTMSTRLPPEQRFDDNLRGWRWHLEMVTPLAPNASDVARSTIEGGPILFSFESRDESTLVMTVMRPLEIPYARAWDDSFRAMLLLEELLGPIARIEGVPRDEWRLNFAISETVGALEGDKTALMRASQKGEYGRVKELLSSGNPVDINATSPSGITALMYAAAGGHYEVVRLLLDAGADVNAHGGECTPLQAAVGGGGRVVTALLDAGADVDARNRYGQTALMYAARLGEARTVELLLGRGANPRLRDNKGASALYLAEQNNHDRVVELIKQCSGDES